MPSKPPYPIDSNYRIGGNSLVARYWFPTVVIVSIFGSLAIIVLGKF
jgi:hypothetical protein